MTKVLVVVADTHINSTVGLIRPLITLDDGGEYRASKGQKWLASCFSDFIDHIPEGDMILILNGDIGEGDINRRSKQMISRNKSTITRMMFDTLEPLLNRADKIFVVRGTAAHVGQSASIEEEFASDIGAERCPETKAYSFWQLTLNIDGVRFDVAHHANMGRLPWTAANALNALATRTALLYRNPPDVVIRSHNHRFAETGESYPTRVVYTPAWQLGTEYMSRLGGFEPADIGGIYFVVTDGQYQMIVKRYKPANGKEIKV